MPSFANQKKLLLAGLLGTGSLGTPSVEHRSAVRHVVRFGGYGTPILMNEGLGRYVLSSRCGYCTREQVKAV